MHRSVIIAASVAPLLAVGVVATSSAASAGGSSRASSSALSHGIAGAWRMEIDPNGPSAPPPAFSTLVAFNAGGTMSDAVGTVPKAPELASLQPDAATSAVGSWKVSGGKVVFTFERFLLHDGVEVARQRVSGTAKVTAHGTRQVGTAQATFFDVQGRALGPSVSIVTTGTRILP